MSRLQRLLRWRRCRRGLGLWRGTRHRTSDRPGDRSASSPKYRLAWPGLPLLSSCGLELGAHGWVGGRKTYTRPLRVQFRLGIVCWELLGGAEEGFGNFHCGCAGCCCLRQTGGAADADYIDEEDGVALVEEVGCPALAVVWCLEPCLYCHLETGVQNGMNARVSCDFGWGNVQHQRAFRRGRISGGSDV